MEWPFFWHKYSNMQFRSIEYAHTHIFLPVEEQQSLQIQRTHRLIAHERTPASVCVCLHVPHVPAIYSRCMCVPWFAICIYIYIERVRFHRQSVGFVVYTASAPCYRSQSHSHFAQLNSAFVASVYWKLSRRTDVINFVYTFVHTHIHTDTTPAGRARIVQARFSDTQQSVCSRLRSDKVRWSSISRQLIRTFALQHPWVITVRFLRVPQSSTHFVK